MADEEVLFDDVYELCEIIGKWVSGNVLITLNICTVVNIVLCVRAIISQFIVSRFVARNCFLKQKPTDLSLSVKYLLFHRKLSRPLSILKWKEISPRTMFSLHLPRINIKTSSSAKRNERKLFFSRKTVRFGSRFHTNAIVESS